MGDPFVENLSPRKKTSSFASVATSKRMPKSCSITARKSAGPLVFFKDSRIRREVAGDAAMFLIKVAALEILRRFSKARCPFVWSGIQALQVLCYPPLKWIQRWAPLKGLVNGMQMLSRPLLVLSIANAFSDQSEHNTVTSNSTDDSPNSSDPQGSSELNVELPSEQSTQDTSFPDEAPQNQSSKPWLLQLYTELENQGINLPERISEDDLHGFYFAANGNFPCFLASVKKTIRWRETYSILTEQELEMWSHVVFWHGFDVKDRPSLFIRLGLACSKLSSPERPRFVQAIVSQVEHGILHLVDHENPQITVLVDCEGLSPVRVPMQMLRSCAAIFQDHFPNRLGLLYVIRLPPVVRVISQTFIQVLKPSTREKLKIYGEMYHKFLMENFQTLPSYLGTSCVCIRCAKLSNCGMHALLNETHEVERHLDSPGSEELALPHPNDNVDMYMNGNYDHMLRSAVVGILLFWILIALIAGIYDPESSPNLPS